MEDQQIIELYWKRDEAAVVQTAKAYTGYCHAVAERILQSPEDAEEALNDTWLAAWNSIPPHRPHCLRTFLGRLTRNISLNMVRAKHAQKRSTDAVRVVYDEVEEWLAAGEDIERELSSKELAEAINRFLGGIPETERQVFVRRYWYVQTVSEISACYGFSESKVKSMLLRIRKKLYTKLKEEELL